MKTKSLYSLLILFSLLTGRLSAQLSQKQVRDMYKAHEKDTTGFMVTMDNKLSYLTKDTEIFKEDLSYYDSNAKQQRIKQKNVKILNVGDRLFLCFPRKTDGTDLQLMELIASNDKYMLLQYWRNTAARYFFIYDFNDKLILDETPVYNKPGTQYTEKRGAKNNNEKAVEAVTPYFDKCPELIGRLKGNIAMGKVLTYDIQSLICEGGHSKNEIIEKFKKKKY